MAEQDDVIEIRDHRQPGWFWAQNEVLDEHGREIGPVGVAVYMVLARYALNRTQEAWPGLRKIAAMIGTRRKQVRPAIVKLEELGLITVEKRVRRSSVYTLLDLKGGGVGETPPSERVGSEEPQVGSEEPQGGVGETPELDLRTRLTNKTRAEEIWDQAKEDLKLQMTRSTFDTWLATSQGLSLGDHILTVGVKNQYAVEWCTHRLGELIERALVGILGEGVEVRFEVV